MAIFEKKNRAMAITNELLDPMEIKEDYETMPDIPSKNKISAEDSNTKRNNIIKLADGLVKVNSNVDYIKELLTKVEDISTWQDGEVWSFAKDNVTKTNVFIVNRESRKQVKDLWNKTIIGDWTANSTKSITIENNYDPVNINIEKYELNFSSGQEITNVNNLITTHSPNQKNISIMIDFYKNKEENSFILNIDKWDKNKNLKIGGTLANQPVKYKLREPLRSPQLFASVIKNVIERGLDSGKITQDNLKEFWEFDGEDIKSIMYDIWKSDKYGNIRLAKIGKVIYFHYNFRNNGSSIDKGNVDLQIPEKNNSEGMTSLIEFLTKLEETGGVNNIYKITGNFSFKNYYDIDMEYITWKKI